jgi:uncharacterized protein with ParB-like and HNH nuclease domain
MKNQTETIRKFVSYLNNPEKDGGFWLPNIQRPFVWKEEQIERLYDSILREYPIGTLLVWKTKDSVKRRKFIDVYKDSIKLTDFYAPDNENVKMLVLDGQQRLQSLFIGLKGSYNGKELAINIKSGEVNAPEDIKYKFDFMKPDNIIFPWVKFKSIVNSDNRPREIKANICNLSKNKLSEREVNIIDENIDLIREVFCIQENIVYQEVDSIDKPESYTQDDIVEIFIRANSGGTILNKSDLMFSLLVSSWDEAEDNMIDLLDSVNKTGYKFSRDFVLKTCLVLLKKGARYNVDKFREEGTRESILDNWDNISKSIRKVKDYIYGSTFLKSDKNIPSYLSLIPLIYFNYHYGNKWENHIEEYHKYLIRTSLAGVFGGTPDNLLDRLIKQINSDEDFILNEIFGVIKEANRNLEITKETILNINYWKKEIHFLFNLWYGFNYQPSLSDNTPSIDHIFPQSVLKKFKDVNPVNGKRNIMRYKWWHRDQIGNLMLLTMKENGAGGKTDILPEEWFADKTEEYLDLHLIPKDTELWKLENFEKFIEVRKQLILDKFNYLLTKESFEE